MPERLMQVHAPKHKNVWPTSAIEVVNMAEHAVGRAGSRIERFGAIELVLSLEIGTRIPTRAGYDINLAIAIDVASRDLIAKVKIVQNQLFESDGCAQFTAKTFKSQCNSGKTYDNERLIQNRYRDGMPRSLSQKPFHLLSTSLSNVSTARSITSPRASRCRMTPLWSRMKIVGQPLTFHCVEIGPFVLPPSQKERHVRFSRCGTSWARLGTSPKGRDGAAVHRKVLHCESRKNSRAPEGRAEKTC